MITSLLFTFLLSGISAQTLTLDEANCQTIKHDFDSLQESIIPLFIEKGISDDWYVQNTQIIIEENPAFKIDDMDSLKYLIIPSLNIPVIHLQGYGQKIFDWFDKGKLTIDRGDLLVFEHDRLIAKFNISNNKGRNRLIHESFSQDMLKISISSFKKADFYFKVAISDLDSTGLFPISGTLLVTDRKLTILSGNKIVTNPNNIHPSLFETEEEFNNYVSKIVFLALNKPQN